MRKKEMKQFFAAGLCLFTLSAGAQSSLKEKYPAEEAVYTQISSDIHFRFENNKWIANKTVSEDLVFLTDNAVKMMSRGRIYHSGFNQLKKWEAYVQTQESKKIKVINTTLASSRQDAIFYDDVKATSFDYAGAVVGATRHMEYEMVQNDIHLLSPHYFERYFPVHEAEVRITVPEELKLKYVIKGLQANKVTVTETKKGGKTVFTFRMNEVEGEKHYPDAPDNAYYSTHLIYYIEQVKENGEWKNFLSSPKDLYTHSYKYIRNTNQSISDELKRLTDSLTGNAPSPEEKTRRIYRWVQGHIKYVAFEDGLEGFIPREASLVYTRRFGDCKDMASILTAMLNHAGVPAHLTWIGTRSIPYDYADVPLPISDNHMIATARIGSRYIFLDATDEGCIFGRPPHSIQGKQAMLSINDTGYRIVRVPVIAKQENRVMDTTFIRLDGKEAKGSIKVRMTGYDASRMISSLNYRSEKDKEDYLKGRFFRGSNKLRFSNWKVDAADARDEVTVTADFVLPDYVRTLGDEIFFNLNLFKWFEHQEIDYPKRKSPIEFSYLQQASYTVQFQLPVGYKVAHLPKGEDYKNEVWGFQMRYGSDAGKLWLTCNFDTDHLLLLPSQFEQWNKVLEHIFPHYKETVALSKK